MNRIQILLPCDIVNPHGHGRGFGSEDYKIPTGTYLRESAEAGIGYSMLMPNTKPALRTKRIFNRYATRRHDRRLGTRTLKYFGADDRNFRSAELTLKDPICCGTKAYPLTKDGKSLTTGKIGIADEQSILTHMGICAKAGKPFAVHCSHPDLDPMSIDAEVEDVKRHCRLGLQVPGLIIIFCHLTCERSIRVVEQARSMRLNAYIEIAPHHTWFSSDGHNWTHKANPVLYHCFNPLRPWSEVLFLRHYITIPSKHVMLAGDSAPHHWILDKLANQAAGIPNHKHFVPVAVTLSVEVGIEPEQLARLLSWNAARVFNLPINPRMHSIEFEWKKDCTQYNNGTVANPFFGSRLLFPVQ